MNVEWLLANAGFPIRYNLTRDASIVDDMLENSEIKYWLGRILDRVLCNDLSDIHGSHDYRYENIIGKCFILGLNSLIPQFDAAMRFFIEFLDSQITKTYDNKLTFGKIYEYRDYETVMTCYMPFFGYSEEKSVRYVANKRADVIYEFTKQNRYNVYRNDFDYPGAKKEWKPYILDPSLYADGNIAFPSIHDLILFAGMYPHFSEEQRTKVETTVKWLFGGDYSTIHSSLYYYAPDDPSYKSKSINNKVMLIDFDSPNLNPKDTQDLLYCCFILSHFQEAKKSDWFAKAIAYLKRYETETGRYIFPKEMISEQKNAYVHNGGHMNVGESKKNKNYAEIISTYWMHRILANDN